MGPPWVVKPRAGSLSKHVTCNIHNFKDLQEAIRVAKIVDREFIVEEYIRGSVYRITLVGHKMIAGCLKEPPNVIGNGRQTIRELIAQKNKHPWRGEPQQKNYTLKKISVTDQIQSRLASEGWSLSSCPPVGQKVYLHSKVVLASGTDIHDKTDEVHRDNVELFETISRLCQFPIIGLDFICPDISKSYRIQKSALIEANSLPYIDMHHYPVTGLPRDVGTAIVDYLYPQS